jgi:hypothetical protein
MLVSWFHWKLRMHHIKIFSGFTIGSVTTGHRSDRLKIITRLEKRTDIWHLVLLGKISSSRSRHLVLWSLGTLTGQQRFYGTRLVTQKERCYHPPKRHTWDRLHCWFSLKLLKNLFSFSLFLFFLSCFWLWYQWTIPTNIYNFGVGKYRTNPKNTILLTLASVNIFAKNAFEEEIFYVIFFLVYPLLLFALFRWK